MLRISKIIDYGTLVLTLMATRPGHYFSAADLAENLGLGHATVSKILKQLTRAGMVRSMRGAHGGYTLTRPSQDITLADIIDALDEQPFGLTECTATPGACSHEPGCHIRINWQRINNIVRTTLEEVSVADMASPAHMGTPMSGPKPISRRVEKTS